MPDDPADPPAPPPPDPPAAPPADPPAGPPADPPAGPPAADPPASEPTTVEFFSAQPAEVDPGGTTTLHWSIKGAVDTLELVGVGALATGDRFVEVTVEVAKSFTLVVNGQPHSTHVNVRTGPLATPPVDPGTAPDPGVGTPSDPGTGTQPDPGAATPPDPGAGTPPDPDPGTAPDPGAGTSPGGDPPALKSVRIEISPPDDADHHDRSYQVPRDAALLLIWESENATAVVVDGAEQGASGSMAIETVDRSHTLFARGNGPDSAEWVVEVHTHEPGNVVSPHIDLSSGVAKVVELGASKGGASVASAAVGDEIVLSILVSDGADGAKIDGAEVALSERPDGSKAGSKKVIITAADSGDFKFTAMQGGSEADSQSLHLDLDLGLVVKQAPVIKEFLAYSPDRPGGSDNLEVTPGTRVDIKWEVSDDARQVTLEGPDHAGPTGREGGFGFEVAPLVSNPLDPGRSVRSYTLSAENESGAATRTVTVRTTDKLAFESRIELPTKTDLWTSSVGWVTAVLSVSMVPSVRVTWSNAADGEKDMLEKFMAQLKKIPAYVDLTNVTDLTLESDGSAITTPWNVKDGKAKISLDYKWKVQPMGLGLKASMVLIAFEKNKEGKVDFKMFTFGAEASRDIAVDFVLGDGVATGAVKIKLELELKPQWKTIWADLLKGAAVDVAITASFIAGGIGVVMVGWKAMEDGTTIREKYKQVEAVAGTMADGVVAGMRGGGAPPGAPGAAGYNFGVKKLAEYKASLKSQQPDASDAEVDKAASEALGKHGSEIGQWAFNQLFPLAKDTVWEAWAQGYGGGPMAWKIYSNIYGILPDKEPNGTPKRGSEQYYRFFLNIAGDKRTN